MLLQTNAGSSGSLQKDLIDLGTNHLTGSTLESSTNPLLQPSPSPKSEDTLLCKEEWLLVPLRCCQIFLLLSLTGTQRAVHRSTATISEVPLPAPDTKFYFLRSSFPTSHTHLLLSGCWQLLLFFIFLYPCKKHWNEHLRCAGPCIWHREASTKICRCGPSSHGASIPTKTCGCKTDHLTMNNETSHFIRLNESLLGLSGLLLNKYWFY